jgi:hypothetical protein
MVASFILVGSWIPFMGDPCPGSGPPKDPTVAASPSNPAAASSSDGPHEAASPMAAGPSDRIAASSSHRPHQAAGPMNEVFSVFEKLVDSLPPMIQEQFRKKSVLEKIQYAGLPCPLVIRYGQMHTLPGISLPASSRITI